MPYLFGVLGLIVLWVILRLAAGKSPSSLFIGEDGRPSTSKAQLVAWTGVVVFGYVAMYTVRVRMGQYAALPSLPINVLIALGISSASAVTAKAIAVNSADNAATAATVVSAVEAVTGTSVPTPPPTLPSRSGILVDDSGTPDLGKVQVIIWTIIALGVYLVDIGHAIHMGTPEMPDIDRTLMILMGLGHSVYLGKKITES